MVGMLHLISHFYQNRKMPSTLLKMKAVPSNAAICKHGTTRRMSIRCRCCSSVLETVPSAPTTIDATTALTSPSLSIFIRRSWYFVIFACSLAMMLWSPSTARSIRIYSFFSLSITKTQGLRCYSTLSVCIVKSHSNLHLSFSCTSSFSYKNHFSWQSIKNFLHSNQFIFFPRLSCRFWYWLFARLEISIFSLQRRHNGVLLVSFILLATEFVFRACFCAAQTKISVPRFNSLPLNHSHLLTSVCFRFHGEIAHATSFPYIPFVYLSSFPSQAPLAVFS